jgi:hypothetical protein
MASRDRIQRIARRSGIQPITPETRADLDDAINELEAVVYAIFADGDPHEIAALTQDLEQLIAETDHDRQDSPLR